MKKLVKLLLNTPFAVNCVIKYFKFLSWKKKFVAALKSDNLFRIMIVFSILFYAIYLVQCGIYIYDISQLKIDIDYKILSTLGVLIFPLYTFNVCIKKINKYLQLIP